MQNPNVQRYAVLACGTIVMLVLGLIYAWSIFVAPLEAEFGWTRSETATTFSISMVMWSCGMLSCGWLMSRFPPRSCFAMGIALIACGFILSSNVTELWQLYISYGVFCGFGTGLCYNLWTSVVFAHFSDGTGFAGGVLLMGFGMGAMVLGSAVSLLIASPVGWRGAFAILAALAVTLAAASMYFLRMPDQKAPAKPKANAVETGVTLTGGQMLRSPSFWTFALWRVLVMGGAAAVIAQTAPIMASIGADVAFCSAAVGALSIGNGCGRPIVGIAYDRIGRDRTLVALAVAGIAIGVALVAAYVAQNILLLAVALFFEGVLYGGYATVNTTFIKTTYGQAHVATNLGISSFSLMPFNAVFPVLMAIAFQLAGDYALALGALPVIAAISLVAAVMTSRLVSQLAVGYDAESGDKKRHRHSGKSDLLRREQ
ncbi:MFS transporter [Eggerthellaceae bacterium zg-887]|uniref:MFS transporter n=1 Tax=Xiamenia xianingshaonis TaxID=2682776 RepID=UPI001408F87D|nr:MFS transporter [Xiamenia xianingshaonis]NHM16874.1 MFS transporter [Xiamenia xianingshaonis]